MRSGDIANTFCFVNAFLYMVVMIGHVIDPPIVDFFDKEVKIEGFCVSNKDQSVFYQSHFLSFYGDVVGASILLVIALFGPQLSKDVMLLVRNSIGSILIHGCGHAYIGYQDADPTSPYYVTPAFFLPEDTWKQYATVAFFCVFWFNMISAANLRGSKQVNGAMAVFHAVILTTMIPGKFGFTYVQSVLLFTAALAELSRENKGTLYDLQGWIVMVPVGIVGWVEATQCDEFFRDIGGHFWYDMTIVISGIAFYAAAYVYEGGAKNKKLE